MSKRIITLAESSEAVGVLLVKRLLKKMGIAYYDKDIIRQIAEQSGLSPEYI